MFLKIAKEQCKYYNEDIIALLHKGNSIIEFCSTPLLDKNIKLTKYKKQKLQKIVKNIECITNTLSDLINNKGIF